MGFAPLNLALVVLELEVLQFFNLVRALNQHVDVAEAARVALVTKDLTQNIETATV